MHTSFEWDEKKNAENILKHEVDFETAQYAFLDKKRVIAPDLAHSKKEKRFFCIGRMKGGVLTVRFTYRGTKIRIFGAGYWRHGKNVYEKKYNIHK